MSTFVVKKFYKMAIILNFFENKLKYEIHVVFIPVSLITKT